MFHLDRGLGWIEPTQLAFVVLGASMAALALMILVVAVLATGATRHEVYRSSLGRAGGRIACMIFIFIIYLLLLAWISVFASCIVMTVFYTIRWVIPGKNLNRQCSNANQCIRSFFFFFLFSWGVCNTDEIRWGRDGGFIDFYPFHFLFPDGE